MTQREFVSAYIGLGANLGDARQAIFDAVNALKQLPLTQVRDCSSLYRSEPVAAKGPDFFNAVVHLQTQLNPIDLSLQVHNGIEKVRTGGGKRAGLFQCRCAPANSTQSHRFVKGVSTD